MKGFDCLVKNLKFWKGKIRYCYEFKKNCWYRKHWVDREHWFNFDCDDCDLKRW